MQSLTSQELTRMPLNSDISNIVKPLVDLNVLSLFSGCGGMDIGLEGGFVCHRNSLPLDSSDLISEVVNDYWVRTRKTRFKTIFANDIIPQAGTAWLRYMQQHRELNDSTYHIKSIVDLVKKAESGEPVFPKSVDLVVGGFPCQDFSVAGSRRGFNSLVMHHGGKRSNESPTEENRGLLYYWMKRVIDLVSPKMFIAENVKGLVNLGNVKDVIQADFAQSDGDGYIVLPPRVLYAVDYGVPQTRERVFFIGLKKSALRAEALASLSSEHIDPKYDPYPNPTHAEFSLYEKLQKPVACRDVLKHLPEPTNSHDLSHRYYSKAKYMGRHCQGQTEIPFDGQSPTIRSEHHGNIEYRRLSKEHGGRNAEELFQGLAERRLTPRECALIQTFPPDYEFVVRDSGRFVISPSAAYKMIGNAVPPILAYSLAIKIESIWNNLFF